MPANNAEDNDQEKASVQRLVIRALRKNGYRKLCKGEESDYSVGGTLISIHLLMAVFVGLSIFLLLAFDLNLLSGALIVFAVLLAGVFGNMIFGLPYMATYLTLLFAWIGVGLFELWIGGLEHLWPTHVLPFCVTVGVQLSIRALRLSAHVPLFIPLALIIVLLPLLTEDPWRLATSSGMRLLWLAVIALVPLVVLFAIRLARLSISDVLVEAVVRLEQKEQQEEDAFRELKRVHDDRDGEIDKEETVGYLREVYERSWASAELAHVVIGIDRTFRSRAILRFVALVIGVTISVWGLIYVLAWAVVPTDLARDWSTQEVSFLLLNIGDLSVAFPVGPYVAVASFFAIVACVGFLGFTLTEDQHSTALWNAVVNRPAEMCLMLALPYVRSSVAVDASENGKPNVETASN